MQIHQILAGAAEGDAVTRIAFNTRDVLRRYGSSEIYAHHIDPTMEHVVRPLSTLPAPTDDDDIVLLRASIGDVEVYEALAGRSDRLWIGYHNISPSEPFRSFDPPFADLLDLGREQLRALQPRVSAAFADSTFNAHDLTTMGYRDVAVVPPLLDPRHLIALHPDTPFMVEISRQATGPLVLFVGQLLPHKRPELLIAAHHLLNAHIEPDAALVLVGAHRSPEYVASLAAFGASLNLQHLWLTGPVTDRELAELYRRADVFVTASSHEGFCVPIVEAMANSVPVVATRAGALCETVGDAGILLDDASPESIAETVGLVLGDERLHAELAIAGRRRADELSLDAAQAALSEFVELHLAWP